MLGSLTRPDSTATVGAMSGRERFAIKIPTGSLSAFKWRCYIYDIVRFLTNDKFMSWFLDFDPHAYFNVLQKLYQEPEPYEYIKS